MDERRIDVRYALQIKADGAFALRCSREVLAVFDINAPEALLRALILVLPLSVLLLLLVLAMRLRNRTKAGHTREPERVFDPQSPSHSQAETSQAGSKVETTTMKVMDVIKETTATGLEARIKQAESRGETAALAGLYLDLARARRAAGLTTAALDALRSAAGTGAMYGPKSKHAEARIGLAEAALGAGDMISACEQWQMARMALHDGGDAKEAARVDALMRQNGCPTDWVLTDF